jgi:hypothetical protein
MISLLGSTYICEEFLKNMNITKNPYRNPLIVERLEIHLNVAASQISPDINI